MFGLIGLAFVLSFLSTGRWFVGLILFGPLTLFFLTIKDIFFYEVFLFDDIFFQKGIGGFKKFEVHKIQKITYKGPVLGFIFAHPTLRGTLEPQYHKFIIHPKQPGNGKKFYLLIPTDNAYFLKVLNSNIDLKNIEIEDIELNFKNFLRFFLQAKKDFNLLW